MMTSALLFKIGLATLVYWALIAYVGWSVVRRVVAEREAAYKQLHADLQADYNAKVEEVNAHIRAFNADVDTVHRIPERHVH